MNFEEKFTPGALNMNIFISKNVWYNEVLLAQVGYRSFWYCSSSHASTKYDHIYQNRKPSDSIFLQFNAKCPVQEEYM